jgi:hypothetical protein
MLNSLACYLLSSHPNLSPFTLKFFLRLMSEFDLRKPHSFDPLELTKLFKCQPWEAKASLVELEEVGMFEELGDLKSSLSPHPILQLRKEFILSKEGELEEWLRSGRELRERLTLARRPGENWKTRELAKKLDPLPLSPAEPLIVTPTSQISSER